MLLSKPSRVECTQVVDAYLREIKYLGDIPGKQALIEKRQAAKEEFIIHAFEIHGEELFVELSEMNLDKKVTEST
jgi:hypothetical protein